MTRLNLLFSLLVFAVSCSAQQKTEQPTTTNMCVEFSGDKVRLDRCCSNHCGQALAACTERHPGDFSACSQERTNCESTCRSDIAVERLEKKQGNPMPTIVRPDMGAASSADAGTESVEPAAESAGETPQ